MITGCSITLVTLGQTLLFVQLQLLDARTGDIGRVVDCTPERVVAWRRHMLEPGLFKNGIRILGRVNRQILPRRQLLPKIVVFTAFDQYLSDPTPLHLYDSSRRFYYVPAVFSSKNHLHISSEHRDISIFNSSIPAQTPFFVPFFIAVFNIHHEETQ